MEMNENLMIKEIKEKIEELRFNEHYINDNYVDIYKLHKILDEYLKIEATRINMMMKQTQIQHKQLQTYKDKEEEYKQIISGLEIIKEHNMPNDTKFVIMAKEDYLRNLELLNEGDK